MFEGKLMAGADALMKDATEEVGDLVGKGMMEGGEFLGCD